METIELSGNSYLTRIACAASSRVSVPEGWSRDAVSPNGQGYFYIGPSTSDRDYGEPLDIFNGGWFSANVAAPIGYTFTGLRLNQTYEVLLFLCCNSTSGFVFDISVTGASTVTVSNYDLTDSSGGMNIGTVTTLKVKPDSGGQIVLLLTPKPGKAASLCGVVVRPEFVIMQTVGGGSGGFTTSTPTATTNPSLPNLDTGTPTKGTVPTGVPTGSNPTGASIPGAPDYTVATPSPTPWPGIISAAPEVTTYEVLWGTSASGALDGNGVLGLSGARTVQVQSGTYIFTVPDGPEQYLYIAWPDAMPTHPKAGDGFVLGGLAMVGDWADAARGYSLTENGWPYSLVTVDGVDYRVHRTLYKQGNLTGSFNIVVTAE